MIAVQQVWVMETQPDAPATLHHEGICPTCGQHTEFHFLGEQRWPQRLVEATGCPPVTYLFTCAACQTSLSNLDFES